MWVPATMWFPCHLVMKTSRQLPSWACHWMTPSPRPLKGVPWTEEVRLQVQPPSKKIHPNALVSSRVAKQVDQNTWGCCWMRPQAWTGWAYGHGAPGEIMSYSSWQEKSNKDQGTCGRIWSPSGCSLYRVWDCTPWVMPGVTQLCCLVV